MSLADLLTLKETYDKYAPMINAAKGLTLAHSVEDFLPFFQQFGIVDEELIGRVIAAARRSANDPGVGVLEFAKNGGLMRMLAGQSADEAAQDEIIISCPHCSEMVFL